MYRMKPIRVAPWLLAACIAVAAPVANAQTTSPPAVPPAPPAAEAPAAPAAPAAADAPPPGYWINGIHLSAQIEGGITANPGTPDSGVNFGRLFDDRANQPLLNQVLLTANKPLDPKATGFDWGFKLQFMYGSDARYTHFLGVFDQYNGPDDRNQFDIVEANGLLHLPFPTDGGMDVKFGMYSTPLGYETIDPSTNPFYSHSYIFNFGLPLKHTGVLTTTHVTPLVDIYLGVDSGENTTIGCCKADNNGSAAGIAGFGLNMLDGNLTLLVLSHMGPENPSIGLSPLYNANQYMRYENDTVLTWKVSDAITLVTEANWIRDDFLGIIRTGKPSPANGYGIAQYFSYTISDTATFNARGEVWRDDSGAFVFGFPGNNDPVRSQLGLPNTSFSPVAGIPTTYGAITVGITFKPALPAPITGLLIRPELRVDTSLNGTKPFNNGAQSAVTVASDFVLTF
jgi:Putative beta-barrel porin-2, OmpL-like. bbp2